MNEGQEFGSRGPADLRILTGAVVWMCAIQFFVAQVVVQAAWTTPFSLATNYISDLGNTACANYPADSVTYVCSPWHAVMNISFFLQGVIIIAGALLIAPFLRRHRAKIWVLALLILTGAGMLGVGMFPENVDNNAHVFSAALQFVTGNLALVIIGITRIIRATAKWFSAASIALGSLGLAATVLFPTGNHLGIGIGGMERVAAYTFPIWLIGTGLCLVSQAGRSRVAWEK
ncbi:MAG: DUF998 domain-containing protein [Pyrinomonadaceae bacterium]